ncbi:MAG TPA: AraC family transcriptional regulator [bacterium]|nr:AraC family transcriptional regulator [bacterium]
MTRRPRSLPVRPEASAAEPPVPVAPPRPPDPLSELLKLVRLSGAIFFVLEGGAKFPAARVAEGRALAPELAPRSQNLISYHVVSKGACWAGVYGARPVRLETGDVVVFPRGDAYYLADEPREPDPPSLQECCAYLGAHARGQLPFRFVVGKGAAEPDSVRFICGFLGCDDRPFNPLLESLPAMMVVRRGDDPKLRDRLDSLIALTLAEAQAPDPGADSVRVRLSELLFVEVVRRHLSALPARETGWLAGLRDEMVGRAISRLHEQPAREWTLDVLARDVGASRSALAERFRKLVGQPPMQYLTHWRIQLAAQRLADGSAKVSAIGREVGYDSEAAFSRAFKKVAGVAPAAWRKG